MAAKANLWGQKEKLKDVCPHRFALAAVSDIW